MFYGRHFFSPVEETNGISWYGYVWNFTGQACQSSLVFFFFFFRGEIKQCIESRRKARGAAQAREGDGGGWGGGVGGWLDYTQGCILKIWFKLKSQYSSQNNWGKKRKKKQNKKNYLGTRNAQPRFGRVGHCEIQLRSAKLLAKYSPLLPQKKEKEKKERQKTLFVLSRVQQFPAPPPPLFFFSFSNEETSAIVKLYKSVSAETLINPFTAMLATPGRHSENDQ